MSRCKQLHAWASEGLGHLTIAVNVSVQQFARADFVESVLRVLWQYGVKPEQLELEITESLLMRNVDDTTVCMKRFRAAGVTLSIDDFGTGYSSLGYLRQFPVDSLKIDRSFVKDLHTSDDDAAICAAIIAMARELKLKVIAEGVANAEQLEFLRQHRCDQAQGYLISEPIPVAALEQLLRDRPYRRRSSGRACQRDWDGRPLVMQWVGNLSLRAKLRVIVIYAAAVAVVIACALYASGQLLSLRDSQAQQLLILVSAVGENAAAPLRQSNRALSRKPWRLCTPTPISGRWRCSMPPATSWRTWRSGRRAVRAQNACARGRSMPRHALRHRSDLPA